MPPELWREFRTFLSQRNTGQIVAHVSNGTVELLEFKRWVGKVKRSQGKCT